MEVVVSEETAVGAVRSRDVDHFELRDFAQRVAVVINNEREMMALAIILLEF